MIVRLAVGTKHVALDLRGVRVHALAPRSPRPAPPVRPMVAEALQRPITGVPLAEMAKGWRRVTVLVPDATRKASLPEVLPAILGVLTSAGVREDGITVLVACGTHPASVALELPGLLGPLSSGVRLAQHDARDGTTLVGAGTLTTGLEVRFNRAVLECDGLVAVSTVQHHYFAGFGGGPKMVFPGVAGYREIQVNHSRVLEWAPVLRRHPGCEPGLLKGNPVAEEIAEAAALRPPDLLLALVNGDDGRPRWAGSGPLDIVFADACERVREWYELDAGPFDRMVACAGGHPGDHTLIQAHKGLDAACRFLRPGGELLFLASLAGGAGAETMAPFLADPRPEAMLARLAEDYVQYGHTALRLVEKTGSFRIHLASGLDEALARALGFEVVGDPAAVVDRWRREAGGSLVGVVAGAAVYPVAGRPSGKGLGRSGVR